MASLPLLTWKRMTDRAIHPKPAAQVLRNRPRTEDREAPCTPLQHRGERAPCDGLTHIFRTQYRQLLRFCRMRVRNDADAEDIVQAAFLAARRAYPEKGIEELRPLLFTLVRNTALNHLKASWNRRRHGDDVSALSEQLPCPASPCPEKQLIDSERLALVETVMSGMTPRRQIALRLHRYEGFSYEEIARRLSISPTAVKKHVARGVAEIAARLAETEDPAGANRQG